MAAKACNYLQRPENSVTIDVGDYVTVRLGVENCGNARGNFYAEIFKNDNRCIGKWNQWLNSGEVLKLYGSECDIASMPNSKIVVVYAGGHAEGGAWREDFRDTITISPEAAPPPPPEPPEGEITNYDCPSTLESGERYQVTATGKNIGGSGAYFRFRLFEGSSEITHGGLVHRGAGSSLTQTLSGTMPNRNLNLTLELWRQT